MSTASLKLYRRLVVVQFSILATLVWGTQYGHLQSLHLRLDDDVVLSGRSNRVKFMATVTYQNSTPPVDPWELYIWTSSTANPTTRPTFSDTRVLFSKQKHLEYAVDEKSLTFENVTYNVNLLNLNCEGINFICGGFIEQRSGGNYSLAEAVSCTAIKCKVAVMIEGVRVKTNSAILNTYDHNDIRLNFTIDYNLLSGIPSTRDLWKVRVWLSAFSNGSQPRHSVTEQVLTSVQSSKELVAGKEFGFWNVLYSPSYQELKNIKREEVSFICARFLLESSNYMKLESRYGSIRTDCTELPLYEMTTTVPMATHPMSTTEPVAKTTLPTTLAAATHPMLTTTDSVAKTTLLTTLGAATHPMSTTIDPVAKTTLLTTLVAATHLMSTTTDPVAKTTLPTTSAAEITTALLTSTATSPASTITLPTDDFTTVSQLETKKTPHVPVTLPIASSLEDLAEIDVINENILMVAKNLVDLTTDGLPKTSSHLQAVSTTLQNIANADTISDKILELSLITVDRILQVDQRLLEHDQQGYTTMIVTSLQNMLASIEMDPNEDNFTASLANIALVALTMQASDAFNGITFNVKLKPTGSNEVINVTWSYDENIGNEKSTGLTFPGDLFKKASQSSNIRTNIIVYKNDKLFQIPHQTNQSEKASCLDVSSNVIGAQLLVDDKEVTQLNHDVQMSFNTKKGNGTLQPSCVFWDFRLAGNQGNWSSNGCTVVKDKGGQVLCQCNHLTNFAVLMSPKYGCNGNPYFLDVVSKIGCGVSITALLLTFLTYTLYKNLMGRTPQLILIQWTLSLMCLYIVFLVGIDWSYNETMCTAIAGLLHYFTLTSIFWMGCEAASLFLVFVKGVTVIPRPHKFFPFAAMVAWGLPALLVTTSFFIVGEKVYCHSNYCFLSQGPHLYYGLLLPIGTVLVANTIIFVLILNAIMCRPDVTSSIGKSQTTEATRMIQQGLCIAVLLGITWVFGFLSIGGTAYRVFSYLFCIFNTFQGLAVFLLFCIRRREVREAWHKSLCCTHKQTYHVGHRSRSGTAGSRTDIYNINGQNGHRSRSGTVCSRLTDAPSIHESIIVAFDKV